MNCAQMNLLDEITVDGFCGRGGWSTGFELAIGRPVDVGINHDAAAIALHKANHPFTRHYQTNIFEVDPVEACQGRPVAWAHFSPDCKHFSRAKGSKPVSKQIRSLAWVVLKWASAVHPRIISMENVPEFMTWGPLIAARGKHGRVLRQDGTEAAPHEATPYREQALAPDRSRSGKTFKEFVACLKSMGYAAEWNELRACDYGAPTSRKRFFLLARRDGKPIVWPEPTHGDPHSAEVKCGRLKPWHTAAEIIDWNTPCPSIFERKKPLAENTLRRIAKGIEKYILENPEPFIVGICQTGGGDRVRGVNAPLGTIVSTGKHAAVTAFLSKYYGDGRDGNGSRADAPLGTITGIDHNALMTATVIRLNNHCADLPLDAPLPTITAQGNHFAKVGALLIKYYGGDGGQDCNTPLGTITTHDRFGLVMVHGTPYQIVDIGLRMLTPRELYNAQGFPRDYEIETDCYGKAYPKKEQVARCGNAVPPAFAAALARANWPEQCAGLNIATMAELNEIISA